MARATNDLNAVRMMLGPGIMYWAETSLTFVLAIAVMAVRGLAPGALSPILPAPLVSLAVMLFGRIIHERFEKHPGDVLRHQQPRAGESLRRAHGARLRAGEGRDAPASRVEPGVHRAEHQAGAHLGVFQPMLEALIGVTFLLVLWVGGCERARRTASRSAAS